MNADVSILITCYQKEQYLNEAVESVRRQTRQPKEIILVHDACNEPMAHALATTIILPQNVGVAKARDIAFNYSTGKLVLFLDADDVLSPDYVEKMVLTLAHGADITYPDMYFWALNPKLTIAPPKFTKEKVIKLGKMPMPVSSMMKREVYTKLGGFRVMPVLEDIDFWIRALCNGYTFIKSNTLLWYRQLPGNRNNTDLLIKEEVKKGIFARLNA